MSICHRLLEDPDRAQSWEILLRKAKKKKKMHLKSV